MSLSATTKPVISLTTARQHAQELERFARVEDSIRASKETFSLLRLIKGVARQLQRYTGD